MKAWYRIFPKAFSATECAEILSMGLRVPPEAGTVINYGKGEVSGNQRRCQVRWLDAGEAEMIFITARLRARILEANTHTFGIDCAADLHRLQLTEYDVGAHHQMHEDAAWINPTSPLDRKLTAVLMLSAPESYAGGKLVVDRGGLPESFGAQGDLVVFPSHLRHAVELVTSGVRYTLVGWAYGPPWR